MNTPQPPAIKKTPTPVQLRWIFLAAIVCYGAEAALRPVVGEGIINTGIGLAGTIFLIWGIVATFTRRRRRQS